MVVSANAQRPADCYIEVDNSRILLKIIDEDKLFCVPRPGNRLYLTYNNFTLPE